MCGGGNSDGGGISIMADTMVPSVGLLHAAIMVRGDGATSATPAAIFAFFQHSDCVETNVETG